MLITVIIGRIIRRTILIITLRIPIAVLITAGTTAAMVVIRGFHFLLVMADTADIRTVITAGTAIGTVIMAGMGIMEGATRAGMAGRGGILGDIMQSVMAAIGAVVMAAVGAVLVVERCK